MENKRKIAFFDFCETLVNFQTADAFVDFVREKTQNPRMLRVKKWTDLLVRIKLIKLVEKLTRYRLSINKKLVLWQLKGFEYSVLDLLAEEYYKYRIKPNFIIPIVQELLARKSEGYEIVLVSGGYSIYLKYFAHEYGISNVISSTIGFENNVCTGRFGSIDCLFENKTKLLNQQYDKNALQSVAYSDSKSDIPLFKWANEGYVVSHNISQRWINNYKLNEIIWTEKNL